MEANTRTSVDVVRDMYQAALDGDVETVLASVAEDFVLFEPPFLPYGGTFEGVAGLQRLLAEATQILELPTMTLEYVFGEGERVCAVITCDLRDGGQRATVLEEWIVRDGKISWGRVYWFDPTLVTGT